MNRFAGLAGILMMVMVMFSANAVAGTRDDCITKCKEAASLLKTKGIDAAIKEISDPKAGMTWNNGVNYVFLMNMDCRMIAHPFRPDMKKSDQLIQVTDTNGKKFFVDFINAAKKGRGWVKYDWEVPGKDVVKPKYTYIYRIPDTDYFVGSGFYVLAPGEYY